MQLLNLDDITPNAGQPRKTLYEISLQELAQSIKKAAQGLIKKGKVSEGLLNMVEMAFRAYDPCFACATHALPGQMPLEVLIRDKNGATLQRIAR